MTTFQVVKVYSALVTRDLVSAEVVRSLPIPAALLCDKSLHDLTMSWSHTLGG